MALSSSSTLHRDYLAHYDTMRGYQIEKNIKFEELQARLKDCPEPKAQTDEVVVDVYCAGLNFFDLLQIEVSTRNSFRPEGRGT